ncbi:MAG: hypothetical protein IKE81_09690 [Clostridia bacterium]|nr:hypothetical protein [Clostridia bacterium]
MKATDIWTIHPLADPQAVIRGETYRITMLTDRLVRLEYAQDGQFRDAATQTALNRAFPVPVFTVSETEKGLIVETEHIRLRYDRKPFAPAGLSVELKGAFAVYASIWHYGDPPATLGGTARTLDEADGAIPLGEGLLSLRGYAVLDDSASMGMDETGRLLPADAAETDLYLFAYGHDYQTAIRDYLHLSGRVPLVPRFALGNWWSRFYPYTQQEYRELMERFAEEGIPLSVSVLDMNWHVTDIDPKYGPGWTGYTWDREKFPEPEKLLVWLHEHGLRISLNDHPAEGIRPCEEYYPQMAKAMGEDPADGRSFPFDAADEKRIRAMEETVLTALEKTGVDFWWLDWQQQGGTTDPGMDPLFVLNHTRYLHALETGRPALILSRFGGPGSHRYPVGFSGDTCITWASLDFQPRFTATAANIGYGWWSHDIGGHMHGAPDPELMVRWVQFGVFSPIMRLHSSNNPFMNKEPWMFPAEASETMKTFLRLRHRMIPWLYTQNVKNSEEGKMLLRPLYYDYPEDLSLCFRNRNQYLLGDCLTVCPVTRPMDRETRMGETEVYLPDGIWTDLFTGLRYHGGRRMNMYRPLDTIPVLVRAGGILPMNGGSTLRNGADLPEHILLRLFPGEDGETELIEDNGLLPEDAGYRRAVTRIRIRRERGLTVEILPLEGDAALLPPGRRYTAELNGVREIPPDSGEVCSCEYDDSRRAMRIELKGKTGCLHWNAFPEADRPDVGKLIEDMLRRASVSYDLKGEIMGIVRKEEDPVRLLAELYRLSLPAPLFGAILEMLSVC